MADLKKLTKDQLIKMLEDAHASKFNATKEAVFDPTAHVKNQEIQSAVEAVANGFNSSSIEWAVKELIEKYNQGKDTILSIEKVIASKKEELKSIYGVEESLIDITTVAAAKELVISGYEEREEQLLREIADHKDAIKNLISEYNAAVGENVKKLDTAFARDKEARQYSFKIESRNLDDELKKRKDDFNKEIAVETSALQVREDAVKAKENEINELRAKVSVIPTQIEAAVKAAVEEAKNKLTKELNAESEKEIAILKERNTSLGIRIAAMEKDNVRLQGELSVAGQKIVDIATKSFNRQPEQKQA